MTLGSPGLTALNFTPDFGICCVVYVDIVDSQGLLISSGALRGTPAVNGQNGNFHVETFCWRIPRFVVIMIHFFLLVIHKNKN